MKPLIVALIIVIPFGGMGQKFESAITHKIVPVFPDSIRRGHVKFIRTKTVSISTISTKELLGKINFEDYLWFGYRNDSVVYSLSGQYIESYSYSIPTNILTDIFSCKYDTSNNIIEEVARDNEGILLSRTIYKYDSLNNCIETTSYNKFTNKTNVETEERKQIDNGISEYVYTTDSVGKRKLMFIKDTELEKNKKTISSYSPDGNITYKIVEEVKGNTTYSIHNMISTDGKVIREESKKTRKKNKELTESIAGNTTYYSETILNDNGNVIQRHVNQFNKVKDLTNYVITFSYEYDSKGNYTRKTIYLDNKPILEINRVIGYYD